ncbi:MAG: PAS domain S-box protein [Deltaproteobacteria bacterium]|nr:PAS domain S-box protein [Deltaproteobacteria bacterium]
MPIDADSLPFRQLVDAAPDGIVVTDASGTILLVNAEGERMFGYPRDELAGRQIEILVPDHVRRAHPTHVASFMHAPRLRPMGSGLDLRGRRKDGSEFPVEISLSPIKRDDGTLVVAGIRDITDRRLIEAEARRANAYLVSAVDAIQDAFVLYDEHDRVVLVNSACRQLLGGTLDGAIVGRAFAEVLSAALAAGVFDVHDEPQEALLARWLAYHREPAGVLEVRTGRGRHLRVVERRTPEHGMVSVMMDVTEDVMREAELRTASAAKSEFLSSMSHELRTPLNAVLGFAQLLERDKKQPLSERQQDRLRHVMRGGEHLLRLIDDVLDLSRIEAGRIAISAEPVGLPDVLAEVLSTLEPMATRAQIQLELAPLPDLLPPVVADRTRLAQILMNFGSNAIKYGKANGRAIFRSTVEASRVRIEVIDDGIGIPANKRDKIFEPFQRAGQEAGPIEGTGIGLAISKRLAELMGGSVGFTSEAQRGSQFWVEIPIHEATPDELEPVAPSAAPASILAASATRHQIIYVEDNPSNIAFMRELIDDLASVDLLTAPTAEIGLALIRTHHPAVVIMDINLPGMSGLEAVKLLASWPETRGIPVIGLSAAALVKDTLRAKDAGFHRYLTKPVKVDELTAVLEEILLATDPRSAARQNQLARCPAISPAISARSSATPILVSGSCSRHSAREAPARPRASVDQPGTPSVAIIAVAPNARASAIQASPTSLIQDVPRST